jgi:uroporphyrin-3 C-methyltransferase
MSNETEKAMTTKEIDSKKIRSFSWDTIGMVFLALSVLALLISGYFTYCYFAKSYAALALSVNHLQEAQKQNATNDLQKNLELATQSIQQLQDNVKQLQQNMTLVTQTEQGSKETVSVAEAHYYVKLANTELQYADNVPSAILLLKLADDALHSLSDIKLDNVRKALANDIANLQSVPVVDVTGIYMRLIALNNQIDRLQLPNKIQTSDLETSQTNVEPKQVWWKRSLQATWEALQKIVVVRYNQNGSLPLVTPEQQQFLYQNLHAMVAEAIWGLLHHQPVIYQTSLQQITTWVKQYFVPDSSITQAIILELGQLQTIDIHPKTSALTDSLGAFDAYDANA